MSTENSFVKEESIARDIGILALNRRLFGELSLFWKFFPLTLTTVIAASATPSVFRWYTGNFSNHSPPIHAPVLGSISFYLGGLILITLMAVAFRILSWALFEVTGMWAAQSIHRSMVSSLSRTRTTYFDEHPSARLINRLIRDFDEVRSTAIIFVGDFFNASIEVLSIAVVAYFAHPVAALLAVPLLVAFGLLQHARSSLLDHSRSITSRETSRMIAREMDLIEGRSIFQLYGKSRELLDRMSDSLMGYLRAAHLTSRIEMWTSFWIRFSSEVFALGTLIFLSIGLHQGVVETTLAGVIISSLFGVTGSIGWLDFASGLISRSAPHIRRVFEIVDLPEEQIEERASEEKLAECSHPEAQLSFENFSMSYRADTPRILNQISLQISAGEKVALVGRTGSGKSSLLQSLLRMTHVQDGTVFYHGESIHTVDIHAHRRRFGVVPQFPYLFEGTLRSNLDRTGELADEDLNQALTTVGLSLPLSTAINEGGTQLSLGERQLVCLARVIAAKRAIILMDEPTSGLDPITDSNMTRVLREAFRDRTVITIAHRLESLRHYDRVVELSNGNIVRTMSPAEYLAQIEHA